MNNPAASGTLPPRIPRQTRYHYVMNLEHTDILISGGGVAGLACAAAFGTAGFRVICVDPTPPDARASGDQRSTAFWQPSVTVLRAAGLWDRLAPHATPLQTMRIIDAGGTEAQPRKIKDFNASDLSDQPFGYNLPNAVLRRELRARLAELPSVSFRSGLSTRALLTRDAEARVTLSDNSRVSSRLLIAADGRGSAMRAALQIPVKTTRYGQMALAFAVTHPLPHQDISTEIHRMGGPFTLVPLPDRDGRPASAVVWMTEGPEAQRLQALPEPAFNAAMSERSCHVLGPLTLASERSLWPIISQIADRLSGERCALIAEAAHVVPPIGAQGLNMSLGDIAALLTLAQADPADLGGTAMLDAYHRQRHPQIRLRVMGIDALNRAAMQGAPVLRDLRGLGLEALHGIAPLRKALMQMGLS